MFQKIMKNDASPAVKFGDAYERFRNYFCDEHSRVFHAEGFYIRPKLDAEKAALPKNTVTLLFL